MKQVDVLIVGTGVAGLSAAIYAARYDLKTLALGKELGGATTTAWIIENYPGFIKIDGFDLVTAIKNQAEHLGAAIDDAEVTQIERDGHLFIAQTSIGPIEAHAVILALGTNRRHLGLPREQEMLGKGVHYCVTCDSPLYKSRKVVIVGGGDASVKGALLASRHASDVYLLTIEKALHGEPANMDALKKCKNVVVMTESNVSSIQGDEQVTGVLVKHANGVSDQLSCDGLFIEIGAEPNVSLAKNLGVTLDDHGYIATNQLCETNIEGVTAAGDTINMFGPFKQDIVAAAEGSVAATATYRYLNIHPDSYFCHRHARSTHARHHA